MRPLGAPDGRLVAVRHDNKEVNVTVIVWLAPGMRAIKPDLFGLEFRYEPSCGYFKQVLVERFH